MGIFPEREQFYFQTLHMQIHKFLLCTLMKFTLVFLNTLRVGVGDSVLFLVYMVERSLYLCSRKLRDSRILL